MDLLSLAEARKARKKAESIQSQFNQITTEGDSSLESAQARVDADNQEHDTLKQRIDSDVIDLRQRVQDTRTDIEVHAEDAGYHLQEGDRENWDAKADAEHSHTWGEITEKPTAFPPADHQHGWTEITGKPAEFPPTAHSHTIEEITELAERLEYLRRLMEDDYHYQIIEKDGDGNITEIHYTRTDGTLFRRVVASNPDSEGNYQTLTMTEYEADGTTIRETREKQLTYVEGQVEERTAWTVI